MTPFVAFMHILSELLGLAVVAAILSFVAAFTVFATDFPIVLEAVIGIVIPALAIWVVSRPLGLWRRGLMTKAAVLVVAIFVPGLAIYYVVVGIWI